MEPNAEANYRLMSLSEKKNYSKKLIHIIAERQLKEFSIPRISGSIHSCEDDLSSTLFNEIDPEDPNIELVIYMNVNSNYIMNIENNYGLEHCNEGIDFALGEYYKGDGNYDADCRTESGMQHGYWGRNFPIEWTGDIEEDYISYGNAVGEVLEEISKKIAELIGPKFTKHIFNRTHNGE